MYRIDHLAFRTINKKQCIKFFQEVLGYKVQAEFTLYFNEEKTETADCTALEPSNRLKVGDYTSPWTFDAINFYGNQRYDLSPEIFVSEGSPGSIVHNWASARGGGGLHHIALQVPNSSSVEEEMQKWTNLGWAEGFSSDVIKCDNLCQVFTKPSSLTGVIFELIKRDQYGFCRDAVKQLMESTRGD